MRTRVKLLYFSSNEWGNLGRRKTRLAYEFARQDDVSRCSYVNPPVASSVLDVARGRFIPSHLGDSRREHARAVFGRSRQMAERLWVYTGSTKTIPLTRSERLRRLVPLNRLNHHLYIAGLRRQLSRLPGNALFVWLSHPLQVSVLKAFSERSLACYDWTDDWLQFSILPVADRNELERANKRALREVDLVFAVSESLYGRATAVNPNAHRAPNATDFELISQSAQASTQTNPELQAIPRPRLGYIGQIADNMDFNLIRQLAETHPEWSLVFVGPVWTTRNEEANSLANLTNVHFLGWRSHAQLPGFLRGFDVCLLPHLRTALTASMDPTKLYDYLASGKPIVSTTVAGTERFLDVLYLGDTLRGFLEGVEAGLRENGAKAKRRLDHARQNSWPQRADAMWTTVRRVFFSR